MTFKKRYDSPSKAALCTSRTDTLNINTGEIWKKCAVKHGPGLEIVRHGKNDQKGHPEIKEDVLNIKHKKPQIKRGLTEADSLWELFQQGMENKAHYQSSSEPLDIVKNTLEQNSQNVAQPGVANQIINPFKAFINGQPEPQAQPESQPQPEVPQQQPQPEAQPQQPQQPQQPEAQPQQPQENTFQSRYN